MKWLMVWCLVMVLVGSGCVETKSKAKAEARAAFISGQQQAEAAMQSQEPSVWVVGNVKTPLVPWTQDLTLAKAILMAEYRGTGDPGQITVRRAGQAPIVVDPKKLLQGEDMPLQAGDRVEIRP